jgi:hypothetical protein
MGPLLNDPIFIFLTLALIAAIGFNAWQVYTRNKAWKQVTADTGLQYAEHNKGADRDQTLSGVYRHHQLVLAESSKPVYRNGKRSTNMFTNASTRVSVTFKAPQTNKLTLQRTSNSKNTTPIGDEEFESRFNITCEPEGFAKAFLAKESLRQKLLELKPGGLVDINESEIVYDQTGRVIESAQILVLFDVVCSVADAVEAYSA